jgi:hypothetical protein
VRPCPAADSARNCVGMTTTVKVDTLRQDLVGAALDALGPERADCQVLLVECQRGHTLAAVYSTAAGLAFVSHPRPNMLDEQDLRGVPHHRNARTDREFRDLLHASWADDDLPAGCYCGNRILSRVDIEDDVNAGRQLVTVN